MTRKASKKKAQARRTFYYTVWMWDTLSEAWEPIVPVTQVTHTTDLKLSSTELAKMFTPEMDTVIQSVVVLRDPLEDGKVVIVVRFASGLNAYKMCIEESP